MEAAPSTPPPGTAAGLPWFVSRAHEVLTATGAGPLYGLSDAEVTATFAATDALIARLVERRAALLSEAARRDLHTRPTHAGGGATTTAGWARTLTPITVTQARRDLVLAERLERYDATRTALASGEVVAAQAEAITSALDALPTEAGPDVRQQAEQHLLVEAKTHDAQALTVLGKHLLHVLDPDLADRILGERLDKEERDATRTTSLSLTFDRDGRARGRFVLPKLHAHLLTTALDALANPALDDAIPRKDEHGDRVPSEEVRGQALCRLLERLPATALPQHGGTLVQVVVTMDLATLEGRLRAAGVLGTDLRISAAETRRLACAHGVIPAVLGGASEVLDLGRKRRFHTRAQRLVLTLHQHGQCAVHGCTMPAAMCEAHHPHPWSQGGSTSLTNGLLVCGRHHRLAHDPRVRLERHPDGTHRYHRRT